MRRFFSAGIPMKVMALLSVLGLAILLLPMLNAARYDVPSADDYGYGLLTHEAWLQTGSLAAVLKASCREVLKTWKGWQGTYSAIFLFALNPMIFGEQFYKACPCLVLGMLLAGIFFLSYTVWHKAFRADKAESVIMAVVWAVLCTQFLPRASQGIYWYNGSVYYTFFFGLAAVAYALMIRFILRRKGDRGIGKIVAACILMLILGGGNLVTGLTTAVLLVTMEVLLVLRKRDDWKVLLLPAVCFFCGFALNVSAPGNSVRQGYFVQPGAFRAVWLSFRQLWVFGRRWFSLPVLALITALAPVCWLASLRSDWDFRLPWLVSIYSVCLSAVMFYPPIYAMTEHNLQNLGRITNIIYFGMTFLAIFNLFYWIGWFRRRKGSRSEMTGVQQNGKYSLVFLLCVLLVFGLVMTGIKWYDTTSISAFRSYRDGTMGNYWHVYKLRLEILRDPDVKDAVLKRFGYRPYVLFFHELSEDPNENVTIAEYYGKDSVVAK